MCHTGRCLDSSVDRRLGHRLDHQGTVIKLPAKEEIISSPSSHVTGSADMFNGYRGLLSGEKTPVM